jgi:YfiR/HmsC-like
MVERLIGYSFARVNNMQQWRYTVSTGDIGRHEQVFYSSIEMRPAAPEPLYANAVAGAAYTAAGGHRPSRPASSRLSGARRIWMAGLATLPWLFPVLAAAQAPLQPAPSPVQSDEAAITQVVLGIISYTRWPAELPTLHLCVLAAPQWAAGLLQQTWQVRDHSVISRRLSSLDDAEGCNIIYTGAISEAVRQALSERLTGNPVLSISENDQTCTIGSMFCLNVRAGHVSFMVNLDSVARSGVRVNPAVLQLGHHAPAPNGAPR